MSSSEWRRTMKSIVLAHGGKSPFAKRLLRELERSTRRRREVNLSHLQRVADNGEVVFVPGKVLGGGLIKKKLTVGAFAFSSTAHRKIMEAGGEALTLGEFMTRYGRGAGVRLVG
jgi:large subunit ribosomal protein L18e